MLTVTKPTDRCLSSLVHLSGSVSSPEVKRIEVRNENSNRTVQRCTVHHCHFATYLCLAERGLNRFALQPEGLPEEEEVSVNFEYVPAKNPNLVKLVYLICPEDDTGDQWFDEGRFEAPRGEDRKVSSACKRISTVALMVQYFFATTLGSTFELELNRRNRPVVHRFVLDRHTPHHLWSLSQENLWRVIAQELMASSLAAESVKFIAFCSFSRFHFDRDKEYQPDQQVRGYASVGSSGLALLSTHCLYTWPQNPREIVFRLRDTRRVDSTKFMNDSPNRAGNRSQCFWNTLGALIHEVAHMFNLGHSRAGMMSGNFWKVGHFFQRPRSEAHLWWSASQSEILCANPWLYPDPPKQDPEAIQVRQGRLHSKHGLRLVEYRERGTQMVLRTTIYESPVTELAINPPPAAGLLYALDFYHNHLKHEILSSH